MLPATAAAAPTAAGWLLLSLFVIIPLLQNLTKTYSNGTACWLIMCATMHHRFISRRALFYCVCVVCVCFFLFVFLSKRGKKIRIYLPSNLCRLLHSQPYDLFLSYTFHRTRSTQNHKQTSFSSLSSSYSHLASVLISSTLTLSGFYFPLSHMYKHIHMYPKNFPPPPS